MTQDDLGDRQPVYFDGRTIFPGRSLVTQRKKDIRQLFGFEEQSIAIREYNTTIFESCYATTGSEADYRSNARPAPARPTVALNEQQPFFVTLMEILEWRSRAAVNISVDASIPLGVGAGPGRGGRNRAALVGGASSAAEDQARLSLLLRSFLLRQTTNCFMLSMRQILILPCRSSTAATTPPMPALGNASLSNSQSFHRPLATPQCAFTDVSTKDRQFE